MRCTGAVRPFTPKLLRVSGGQPQPLVPVTFSGRIDELTLEKWIVESLELVGERLDQAVAGGAT